MVGFEIHEDRQQNYYPHRKEKIKMVNGRGKSFIMCFRKGIRLSREGTEQRLCWKKNDVMEIFALLFPI
jgi:hypothetical protein